VGGEANKRNQTKNGSQTALKVPHKCIEDIEDAPAISTKQSNNNVVVAVVVAGHLTRRLPISS